MSSVTFGTGNRNELARLGPTIDATVQRHDQLRGSPPTLAALIDTGASETCIDVTLANTLGLPAVDRQLMATPAGQTSILRYLARVEFPGLNVEKIGRFPGVHLASGGQPYQLLIGRDILQHLQMSYDGPAGAGTLTI